jgi:drug/metabolite transporter (DMT)-like permease
LSSGHEAGAGDRGPGAVELRAARETQRHEKRWGLAAVGLGALLLGLSAIFVKWAMAGGATSVTVGFFRMLVALPGAYVLARRTGSLGSTRGRWLAMLAGSMLFVDLWLWHEAMHFTSAANATLLVGGLSPVWVAMVAMVFLHLRYGPLGWAGQALGLVGASILALARGARVGSGRGEALAVIASFSYAAFTLALGRSRRTLVAEQALLWMSFGCWACFAVTVLVLRPPLHGYTAAAWGSLLGLGTVVQLLAWWLCSWGLGHVEPAIGAIGLQGQQVATLFLAAALLGEPLRPLGLVGAALIVGGILCVSRGPRSARPASHGARQG